MKRWLLEIAGWIAIVVACEYLTGWEFDPVSYAFGAVIVMVSRRSAAL